MLYFLLHSTNADGAMLMSVIEEQEGKTLSIQTVKL